MAAIRLTGHITKKGELEIKLPEGLPVGEVRVVIKIPDADQAWEEEPWTEEEIQELLRFRPMTGAEIVAAGLTGGWEDQGITDSVTWVEEVRRKARERHGA